MGQQVVCTYLVKTHSKNKKAVCVNSNERLNEFLTINNGYLVLWESEEWKYYICEKACYGKWNNDSCKSNIGHVMRSSNNWVICAVSNNEIERMSVWHDMSQ